MALPLEAALQKKIDESERRRSIVLRQIAQGQTIKEAAKAADVHPGTIERWGRRYPEFRKARDEIRAALRNQEQEKAEEVGGVLTHDGTFQSFRKKYFGFDTYWHQQEMVRAIETAPRMEISMVNVPPEHGKTTLLTDYICYRIALDPNIRITFVSEGQPHAKKVVAHVKDRLTRVDIYPDFITKFGPFHIEGEDSDKPWTAQYLTVHNANADERDYTLEARGIRSAIAGTRADLMIIDDVQSRRSLNQTESIIGALRQDFFTRVGKDGKIIVVGTRAGEQDVYQALMDEDLVARHVELPATDRDGEALCPELWDGDSLKIRRKQVGEEVWWRTYQQRPAASGTKTFTPEAVDKAQDENLTVGAKTLDGEDVYTGRKIVAAIDPALSGGNVLHVAGFNNDDYVLYDIWMSDNIGRVEKILEQIEEAAQLYRFSELVVEVNAFQRGMARDDRLREMANRYGFQIVEHETGKNKTDAAYGVAQMPTDFRTGAIRIPAADAESQAKFNELCTQLERWRPDLPARILKQDAVMSLWFGWLRWSKTRRFSQASAEQWKKRGAAEALSGFKRRSAATMAAKKRTDR